MGSLRILVQFLLVFMFGHLRWRCVVRLAVLGGGSVLTPCPIFVAVIFTAAATAATAV